MAFFVGDLKGQNGHDEMGKQIGEQGRMWTHEYWRLTDMQAYMYLLLLTRLSRPSKLTLHGLLLGRLSSSTSKKK